MFNSNGLSRLLDGLGQGVSALSGLKNNKRFVSAAVIAAAGLAPFVAGTNTAKAAVIVYYNFNTLTPTPGTNGPATILPTSGTATFTTNFLTVGTSASNASFVAFSGTTNNALGADPAGLALALQGSSGATTSNTTSGGNNGKSITFQVDLTAYADPILSFATQTTGTGFKNDVVSYSTDGTSFTPFATYTPGTSFAAGSTATPTPTQGVVSFDFSAVNALDGAPAAYFQITFSGASSTSGNNRIDNLLISASPAPEPASLALLGVGGVVLISGRRKRA